MVHNLQNLRLRKGYVLDVSKLDVVFPETSGVANIKAKLGRIQVELGTVSRQLMEIVSSEDADSNFLKILLKRQKQLLADLRKFREGLENLYETELSKLINEGKTDKLSAREVQELGDEVKQFTSMLNLNLKDSLDLKSEGIFEKLSLSVHEKCPLLYEVIDKLLLTNASINSKHKHPPGKPPGNFFEVVKSPGLRQTFSAKARAPGQKHLPLGSILEDLISLSC